MTEDGTMENSIWTIFHRTGGYSPEFAPVWQRFLCWGGTADSVKGADGNGKGRNRLTLQIRDHFGGLLDGDGKPASLTEAAISPGDLITAGEALTPDNAACWRITAVTSETGIGLLCGTVITAE